MNRLRPFAAAALAAALLAGPLAPAGAQPQPLSADVTRATLPDGMQVVVIRDRLAPVVSTWMNYLAGADDESVTGTAHAQEHMMFRGSRTIGASQFAQTMAVTGGTFNADTQNEITQFFFEVPTQDLDIALHLERSRASGILDSQQGWDEERGAITQEVTRDNSSASYRLYTKAIEHVMAGTPYADTGLGTVASFKQLQAPDLRRFYDRWYHPNNAIYVIAGDVDPQATIAKVTALWADDPSAALPARQPVRLQPLTPLTLRDNSSDPITLAFVAYRVPGYDSPDYYASEILSDILNSPRGALYDLQVSGKALQTFAQGQTYPAAGVSLVGAAVPVSTKGDDAVAEVEAVIDGYKKTGVPADLVEVMKKRELAQAQFAVNSVSGLASTWSDALAVEHRTPDEDLAGIAKVTVDDVNRVLRTDYDNSTATVAISTPKAAAGAAFGGREGENNTVVPNPNTPLPAFAKNVLSHLTVAPSTLAPTQETLPNGIKLIVVPSQISHTVVLRGLVLHNDGVQDPPGKDGIDDITDNLFEFGTQSDDRIAYQTKLDAIAANVSAGTSFGLDVLSSDFDRGVQLLADDELHPRFPADAFAIVKQQVVGELEGTVQSPAYRAQVALTDALLPPGDPGRRTPTPQTASTVTLDDVRSFYQQSYRPDLTTIVVIGDVTPDAARASVEKYFGDWHATGPTPNVFPPPVRPNKRVTAYVPATGRIQAEVTLGEMLPLTYQDKDLPLLQLANTVLTGGFYASLLYHDLREIHGYAYTVDSAVAPGRNRSRFTISYGADPRNVAAASRLVVTDLTALQKRPLDAGRLLRAKALVVGSIPVAHESYESVADEMLAYASIGQPLDQDRIDALAQLAATPAGVRAAMARWIRPQDLVQVVQGPAGGH
ncbi:MAG TPA: pitrilysin family protein [Candidatus Sulfotelmatobacter sp.]|nr:pitrilysin family protein [Candidatus Sulfotelmatobacter sp.]